MRLLADRVTGNGPAERLQDEVTGDVFIVSRFKIILKQALTLVRKSVVCAACFRKSASARSSGGGVK